ncbi:aspartate aminotransferase family protein [Pseudomonas helleri]|jgi:putrescine aminotransferase|uniref:Aminotransferase class III-fold pyridoxal phosphate-dependent enzyme n=1 Tax=Pseudomonas helleri TaxID=1608996 RepID=A0A6A7Z7B0_9PSED|nr:aspartate aminotransferase family protein [Pseudomonas helleri]KMN22285.1 aminotransferase [Pseudomonas helleri]MQT34499.1 aminotransferase class III-fold pyridoxal phosphate-dependent enzyme [Pseudomonas helleri]MQT73496.1 aminotransferase class III-fold pyridoxal phosphate-dependent enzyme [Pseudomonas helleri]MQT94603.1 aminotransferase class III-fold pyridoxal phosphate-dependent enzyme [Pseudomonas helleri]MQU04624.1 aminotransferase class III-fold pyridoxal phosphate-dependent enzyme 
MTSKNPQTQAWQQLSNDHHLAPFSDFKQLKEVGPRIITHAKGVYLWDSEGHKILDGMAGLWCVAIGYGRDELADAASKQMRELPYYNLFFMTAHPPVLELSKVIADIAPEGMNHVFFTGSGSEGNDTMLRMVRHYWAIKGQPNKKVIISRKNGYHGSTVAGASLGGMTYMHEQGDLPIPGITHIPQPYWFGEGGDMSPEEFGIWAANQLEEKILELGVDNVGAFIAEPIQGAGGVIVPPDTYWPRIKEILAKYDILFVADEVICGFGRTAQWFGSDFYDLKPDMMTIAKGLTSGYIPMGGLIVRDEVVAVLNEGGDFNHGFTYSGHPVAAAVALENIRILREEKIIEKANAETAPYLQKRLRELNDHPLVGEVRGVGLLGAIELVQDKATRKRYEGRGVGMICRQFCFDNGLIMRAVGDTMIIAPPLVISKDEIDELVTKARKCLDLTLEALQG